MMNMHLTTSFVPRIRNGSLQYLLAQVNMWKWVLFLASRLISSTCTENLQGCFQGGLNHHDRTGWIYWEWSCPPGDWWVATTCWWNACVTWTLSWLKGQLKVVSGLNQVLMVNWNRHGFSLKAVKVQSYSCQICELPGSPSFVATVDMKWLALVVEMILILYILSAKQVNVVRGQPIQRQKGHVNILLIMAMMTQK